VLVARLRALLRRGAASRPVVLRSGDIELDVGSRSCRRAGETVELTPRELAVLEYLMQRQGEVVPKAEILSHVWDFAFDGGENVVEVHVSALRRKLGADVIETVRGGGYRVGARGH
jgi:DNA-binding response OmpR family regulator